MSCEETVDKLCDMANRRENAIYKLPHKKGFIEEVRTYEAWCEDCYNKHTIRCSYSLKNPYDKFEEARQAVVYMPLIAKGLVTANDLLSLAPKDKEQTNDQL
jgi:hypothetical protein